MDKPGRYIEGKEGQLQATILQRFIEGEQVDLADIKDHLIFNRFEH